MYISVEINFSVLDDHAVLIRHDQERRKFQHASFMITCQITHIYTTFHLGHSSVASSRHSSVLDELDLGGRYKHRLNHVSRIKVCFLSWPWSLELLFYHLHK